jgi:hypothetical protein
MDYDKLSSLLDDLSLLNGKGSREHKKAILRENKAILKPFFNIAFNPYVVLGIKS